MIKKFYKSLEKNYQKNFKYSSNYYMAIADEILSKIKSGLKVVLGGTSEMNYLQVIIFIIYSI